MKNQLSSKRILICGLVVMVWMAQAFMPGMRRVSANSLTVMNLADSGAGSLRQAILDAQAGDTIRFAAGVTGTITLTTGELLIDKNLTIQGPGAKQLTVARSTAAGTPNFRIFEVKGGTTVTINGLTITNGAAPVGGYLGGGIFNHGTLTLNACAVAGNSASSGGIENLADAASPTATLTVNACTISGNSANAGGGIGNHGGVSGSMATLVVNNSTIAGNSAATGGGIYNEGTATIGGSLIARNTSESLGPDVSGTVTSQGFNLIGNTEGSSGFTHPTDQTDLDPGLELDGANHPLLKDNGGPTQTIALLPTSHARDRGKIFAPSTADQRGVSRPMDDPAIAPASGGGVTGDNSDIGAFEAVTCGSGATVVSNTDDSGDGSLRCALAAAFSGSHVTFNLPAGSTITLTSDELLIDKDVTIDGPGAKQLTVARSTAAGTPSFRIFEIKGGTTVTINGLTITNGRAPVNGRGGGIRNRGTLTLNACAVTSSSAFAGGGIDNQAEPESPTVTLTVNACTISGNSRGGGIVNNSIVSGGLATLVVNNSTIAGNTFSARGGGIQNLSFLGLATLTVNNSTIAGNTGLNSPGGGIWCGGPTTIGGSLIARNTSDAIGPDVYGTVTSQGFNLIGDSFGSSGFTHPTDQTGTQGSPLDPGLELDGANKPLLKDNGGPTQTIALICGSPAIDRGFNFTSFTTDQRGNGFARPFNNSPLNASDGTDIGAFELQSYCNHPPVARCHNVTVAAGSDCTAAASVDNGSSDTDDGDTITLAQSPPGPYTKGTTSVTLTVSDAYGGSASCTATVTVIDNTPPVFTQCPGNIIRSNDANACTAVVTYAPTASDNCSKATVTCLPPSGTPFPKGTTSVTCTAKDADNNASVTPCTFTVTVSDTQAPALTVPANLTTNTDPNQCSAKVNYAAATASDNCDGALTPTCTPPPGFVFPKGTTTVNCSVSDSSGNSVSKSFTVTVKDMQPPTIQCPANITAVAPLSCPLATSRLVSYALPAVSDNCAGATVACVPPSGSVFAVGTTSVSCTATDAAGNAASCGFTVTVWTACLQDEAGQGNVCLFNAQTGEYQFCCNGQVIATGTGTVILRGCTVTISHTKQTRRVQLSADLSAKKGTATVLIGTQAACQITDQNMANNSCACPAAATKR